jgi:hypothetical protein
VFFHKTFINADLKDTELDEAMTQQKAGGVVRDFGAGFFRSRRRRWFHEGINRRSTACSGKSKPHATKKNTCVTVVRTKKEHKIRLTVTVKSLHGFGPEQKCKWDLKIVRFFREPPARRLF